MAILTEQWRQSLVQGYEAENLFERKIPFVWKTVAILSFPLGTKVSTTLCRG